MLEPREYHVIRVEFMYEDGMHLCILGRYTEMLE